MGNFSIMHWLVLVVVLALYVWPISQILKKMGYSPWWSLLSLFGPLAWIGLWILAYSRWPVERNSAAVVERFE